MIQALSEEAAGLANKARMYTNYQNRFSDSQAHVHSLNVEEITQIMLSEISDIDCDLTLRKILWEAQEEWGTLFQEWRNCTFQSIDVDLVQRNVSKWLHKIFVLERGKSVSLTLASHLGSHTKWSFEQQGHHLWPCCWTCVWTS